MSLFVVHFFARFIHHTAAQFVGGVTLLPFADFPGLLEREISLGVQISQCIFLALCENGFGTNCGSAEEAFNFFSRGFFSFSKVNRI